LYTVNVLLNVISKANPTEVWTGAEGSRKMRLPEFIDSLLMRVARLLTLRTGLYPPEIFLVLIYVTKLSQPQGHSATGGIMSIKNSSHIVVNPVWMFCGREELLVLAVGGHGNATRYPYSRNSNS
jgi:hypothetical protein